MSDNGVQLYSAHAKELKYSQRHKVLEFIKHDCIKWDSERKCFLSRVSDTKKEV